MRYLSAQSTNARGIYGNKDVRRDINGQVVLDSTDMVLVPKGTTAEKVTSPVNGHMRYNTCLLYTSPSPRDATLSRMPSSA